MKKLIATTIGSFALLLGSAGIAQATPDLCGEHADYADLPNGPGQGQRYITACGGNSGPDYANNAPTPDVSTDGVGGVEPFKAPATGGIVETGTHRNGQNVMNSPQQGELRSSPLFVPQGVS